MASTVDVTFSNALCTSNLAILFHFLKSAAWIIHLDGGGKYKEVISKGKTFIVISFSVINLFHLQQEVSVTLCDQCLDWQHKSAVARIYFILKLSFGKWGMAVIS